MNKQEEIREGILKIQKCEDDEGCPDEYEGFDPCPECRTNKTIKFLHSQGVVIGGQSLGGSHPHLANYHTVEPLIKENHE